MQSSKHHIVIGYQEITAHDNTNYQFPFQANIGQLFLATPWFIGKPI